MEIVLAREHFAQALSHLALQEPEYAPDFLERESLPPKFRNHSDFDYFLGRIYALVAFVARGDHFPLIPPLELP
jgi:hypothetical protein